MLVDLYNGEIGVLYSNMWRTKRAKVNLGHELIISLFTSYYNELFIVYVFCSIFYFSVIQIKQVRYGI